MQHINARLSQTYLNPAFVTRLSFVLAASSNDDLLEAASVFLFTLFELLPNLPEDEQEPITTYATSKEFLSGLCEALEQTIKSGNPRAAFHFLDALASIASECVMDQDEARKTCDLVVCYVEAGAANLAAAAAAGRICAACWRVSVHEQSWETLNAIAAGLGGDESSSAVKSRLEEMLGRYRPTLVVPSREGETK